MHRDSARSPARVRDLVPRCLRAVAAFATAALLGAFMPNAIAHTTSESYLTLRVQGSVVVGQWDIALRDLDDAVELDVDGNGEVTWGELRSRRAELTAYALGRLELKSDGQTCTASAGEALQFDRHGEGGYVVLALRFECPVAARTLTLAYRLFADTNPLHRALFQLEAEGHSRSAVLDPLAGPRDFVLAERGRWAQFAEYVGQGIWHIWIGFDHILFLVSLLLPAVLWREGAGQGGRWVPAERFKAVLWDVTRIVTAFTLAHSITLTLATLGWVAPPSRAVESLIAASVVLAALNNVWPLVGGRRWMVAFGFGLIHGFGFAGALAELGLPREALVLSLVGFNLGVEIGQLTIVALLLPLAYALRRTVFYRRAVLVGGSALIAVVASVWFAERAFGISLTFG